MTERWEGESIIPLSNDTSLKESYALAAQTYCSSGPSIPPVFRRAANKSTEAVDAVADRSSW
jgi:hypothetical protein